MTKSKLAYDRDWLKLANQWLAGPYADQFLTNPKWMTAYVNVSKRVQAADATKGANQEPAPPEPSPHKD